MASCIKDKEDKQKSSGKKKKRSRARKRRNVLNAKFPYNRIEKHSGKNIQRRINIKRNNVQLHNSSKASNFLKKGGSNNNSGLKMSDLDKAGKICENVTTTNDSIIVCDSDSESDTNKDVIEIHDSLPEMFAAHENKSDKDEIIILDDSNNEESETPRKRIRWSDKDKESERKSDVVTTPNSIVVIVSNTPSKAEKSTAMEIINIEDSFTEPETNMTSNVEPRSSETPVATSNQSSTRQQCGVLPLSTSTPHQNTKSVGLQIKPPQNIKITVCGGDRSYRKMGTKQSNITNVNTSATTSSTNIISLVSSDKPNNVLPNITPGSVFGGNLYNAGQTKKEGLRDIVIDGSNVAMGHSLGKFFSVKGLKICIDYFVQRGHKVRAFVPHYRTKHGQSSEPALLRKLHLEGLVVLTPSRVISGKTVTCYDDRLLVQCAAELGAVVVSGDNYRDLLKENPNLRETIEKRLLIPTWVDDIILFPSDPLGRFGPSLDQFLRFP